MVLTKKIIDQSQIWDQSTEKSLDFKISNSKSNGRMYLFDQFRLYLRSRKVTLREKHENLKKLGYKTITVQCIIYAHYAY